MPFSLPIPIIKSKLYRPRNARDLIDRQRLLGAFFTASGAAVTLVSAPAGYGKTTFVSQAVSASGHACAWLSLDTVDSDLMRFSCYLVAALRTALPDSCRDAMDQLRSEILPPAHELAAVLCDDLERVDEPLVLVLDDYHRISASPVHELVNALVERPPRNLHIVLTTRRDPPLSLQTLRARGVLDEFRMQQLAFTATETSEFVRGALSDSISAQAVDKLHRRTEGWPVGLRLAALAVPENSSMDKFIDSIPSDIKTVREYLMREVLARKADATREYLYCTSFLTRFCAAACEAVVPHRAAADTVEPAAMSGQSFLDSVQESGLFTIALDQSGEWFRYHHLFQAMLQDLARAAFGDDEVREIHCRAAIWFEEQGLLEEAIAHLVEADMLGAAASLIVRHRHSIMNNEQWHRLGGWLQMLPTDILATRPELLLLKSRFLRTRGSREESWQALEQTEALLATANIDAAMRDELEGSLASSRCYQLYALSDGEAAAAAARRALELLPEENFAERGFAIIILAGALQMTGDIEIARKTLYAAMSGGPGGQHSNVTFSSRLLLALNFIAWIDADLVALETTAEQGSALAVSADLQETLAASRSFEAAVLYQHNELAAVHACLGNILQGKVIGNAEFHAQCLIVAALAHQELGNAVEATNVAAVLHRFALRTQNAFLIAQAEAFAAEIALRQGRMAAAKSWASRFDPEPLAPIYVVYSPAMTLVKTLVLEDSASSRLRAESLLKTLLDYLRHTHNKRFQIEVLALRAMLLEATGHESAARDDLKEAVLLAQPGRFIRLFVDLGPRLRKLLHGLELDDAGIGYVGEILAAFRGNRDTSRPAVRLSSGGTSDIGVEPLSNRELQVLTLVANLLSNKEIAAELHISTVTVKRHTANIYQKLCVHSRRQAVAKAAGLGLLDSST